MKKVYSDTVTGLRYKGDESLAEKVTEEFFMSAHFQGVKSGQEVDYGYIYAVVSAKNIKKLKEKYGIT